MANKKAKTIFKGISKKTSAIKDGKKQTKKKSEQLTQPKPARQFPNILRFITENKIQLGQNLLFILVVSSLFACFVMTLHLAVMVTVKQNLEGNISQTEKSYLYWQEVASAYPSYPDAYFELAVTAYKLHNTEIAKYYLGKTLSLNPNDTKAREFAKLLAK